MPSGRTRSRRRQRRSALDSEVRIERSGPRLSIRDVTLRIRRICERELTYNYLRFLRGAAAKAADSPVQAIPTECFRLIEDDDGIIAPQIITAAGFYPRLHRAFEKAGLSVDYKDFTNHPRPEVYKPIWKQLDDVEFKHRQRECLELIINNPYGWICCPTAYGKTFLIACMARLWPKANIAITTHSREVLETIYDDLIRLLPSVGIVHGSKKRKGERVMCYSGKSLHHATGKEDALFIDEVHEFATDDYLYRLSRFRRSRNYGFSANSPGDRPDKADFELEGAVGPLLIDIPYHEAVKHGAIVQIRVKMIDVVLDVNPAEDASTDTARERWGIWRNRVRNALIAKEARKYENQQVLIMVSTVEHACFLKKLLPEFTLVYSKEGLSQEDFEKYVDWGLLDGDEPIMTNQRRYQLKKDFESGKLRKVIANTVWSRGVNFRRLQVMIRADAKNTPIADKQIPGRVSRISGKKPYGLLIDFLDQFDRGFKRKATDRVRRYHDLRWDVRMPDRSKDTRYRQGELF